jgi:response regulator RpfG family c-di-GMP phosphodiesterase
MLPTHRVNPPRPTVTNRSVLYLGESPCPVGEIGAAGRARYSIRIARDREEALSLLRSEGPFAAIVADGSRSTSERAALLRELGEHCPHTPRILVSNESRLEPAVAAVHEGGLYRFLRAPVSPEVLAAVLDEALERFGRLEGEHETVQQLEFARETLIEFAERLEERVVEREAELATLDALVRRLAACESLGEIAAVAAETASSLLGGRPIRVTLSGGSATGEACARSGGGFQDVAHLEAIRTDGDEIGSLVLGAQQPGATATPAERRILHVLAGQVALAAGAVSHRLARDLAQHGTILALARLAEIRDDETGKHLERVSEYSRLIAGGLREDERHRATITPAFVQNIGLSAPLHDIGKVGIPDSILLKPGPLSEDEWVIMRRHPSIGAETLRHVLEAYGEQPYLRMAHEIAWCHHERWDGTGYPRGLRGAEIPLAARIMSLADCYDALTRRRPYKRAWSHEEALAYIREQRGAQFDPDVVDSLLARSAEAEAICRRLADDPEEPGSTQAPA